MICKQIDFLVGRKTNMWAFSFFFFFQSVSTVTYKQRWQNLKNLVTYKQTGKNLKYLVTAKKIVITLLYSDWTQADNKFSASCKATDVC